METNPLEEHAENVDEDIVSSTLQIEFELENMEEKDGNQKESKGKV